MRRRLRSAFVVAVLATEAGAVLALARLGRQPGFAPPHHDLARWLMHAPTEDLVAVTARLGGLAVGWWLVVATGGSVARRVVPGWRHLRALDAVTPFAIRGALDRVLVVGLGASLALTTPGVAGAVNRGSPVVRRPFPATATVNTAPTRPPSAEIPVVRAGLPPKPPAPGAPPTAPPDGREAVAVVRAGDNLWVIARRALEEHALPGTSAPLTAAEIAPYWRRVVAANRASLRSGDPDLIFPGERVGLPPTGAGG